MTSAAVVETRGLRKSYRHRSRSSLRGHLRPALDGLDLLVEPTAGGGTVHGFLGPNGSGKTTTLRVLLGLVHRDAGEVRLLGHPVPAGLPAAAPAVGALIEGPQFFPQFSGYRNLRLLADVAGLPGQRITEVLEQVELRDRAKERVKGYSLGMRQRLGIAAALLKAPRLLILDEPTNGLDPAGMREVRQLLRRLGDSGVSVLLSSHLLAEVAQVCDAVTIVAHGRTVTAGAVQDVLARGAGERRLIVRVPDLTAGARALDEAGITAEVEAERLVLRGDVPAAAVNRVLGERGLWLSELREETALLEDVFLALTGDPATDDPAAEGQT
ncbi:MAG: ABC transporter ATP-binding protein [Frankiaceae bacterium]